MNVLLLLLLIPVSLLLGLIGLGFCVWTVRAVINIVIQRAMRRILDTSYDAAPKPPTDEQ